MCIPDNAFLKNFWLSYEETQNFYILFITSAQNGYFSIFDEVSSLLPYIIFIRIKPFYPFPELKMGNMFSSSIQNAYQPQSHASNTQIIHSAEQEGIQEDIEERAYFPREQNFRLIRDYLYPFFQKLNQSRPSLNFLIGASAVLLYAINSEKNRIILERKVNNQSIEIAALNEKFSACDNKQFYIQSEKPFFENIEGNSVLSRYDIHNQPTQGIIEVNSNRALDRVDAFAQLIILKEPNLQLTLPAANTLSPGLSFKFFGAFRRSTVRDGRCLIKAMEGSENIIKLGNNHDKGSISVNSGEYVELVPDTQKNYWYAANRNAALNLTPGFEASLVGQDGWQRLPSGMIMQWGVVLTEWNGMSRVTFPIEFPSNFRVIHGTHWAGGPASTVEWRETRSTKGVTLYTSDHGGTGPGWPVHWTAIGY